MIFTSLVPTLIKGYLKNKYLYIYEVILVRKKKRCYKKILMVESLLFYRSWSRSWSRSWRR